ncbi:hypothetical protein MPH_00920 [Macrophomina phaseolina MS6]|uniref:Uncharacterized protein n=1 Tax=Macrophomina phaseolina (strain MS6) TaxID=1126212 RepID=K2SH04_MACPH|nr:hypothetical protein MPH_00920 [Macrophomina phaseolina MS6]
MLCDLIDVSDKPLVFVHRVLDCALHVGLCCHEGLKQKPMVFAILGIPRQCRDDNGDSVDQCLYTGRHVCDCLLRALYVLGQMIKCSRGGSLRRSSPPLLSRIVGHGAHFRMSGFYRQATFRKLKNQLNYNGALKLKRSILVNSFQTQHCSPAFLSAGGAIFRRPRLIPLPAVSLARVCGSEVAHRVYLCNPSTRLAISLHRYDLCSAVSNLQLNLAFRHSVFPWWRCRMTSNFQIISLCVCVCVSLRNSSIPWRDTARFSHTPACGCKTCCSAPRTSFGYFSCGDTDGGRVMGGGLQ